MQCSHKSTVLKTEPDGCYWVKCADCRARGPKRHSSALALTRYIQKYGAPLVLMWRK